MKLEVQAIGNYPDQHRIENDDYYANEDDDYVSIFGYFGSHGPHVFAAAPELYDALEWCVNVLESDYRAPTPDCEIPSWVYAALAKARGEE